MGRSVFMLVMLLEKIFFCHKWGLLFSLLLILEIILVSASVVYCQCVKWVCAQWAVSTHMCFDFFVCLFGRYKRGDPSRPYNSIEYLTWGNWPCPFVLLLLFSFICVWRAVRCACAGQGLKTILSTMCLPGIELQSLGLAQQVLLSPELSVSLVFLFLFFVCPLILRMKLVLQKLVNEF